VLLRADAETQDRDFLRGGQHQRRTRRHLSGLITARRDHGDAIDIGPARLDLQVDALLRVKAFRLGTDLADLIARDDPAKLQVDHRLSLTKCIDIEEGAARKASAAGQQFPSIDEHDLKLPV